MSNVDRLKKRAAEYEAKRQMDKAVATYLELFAVWDANDGADADVALYNRVGDLLLREGNVGDAMSVWEQAVEYYADRGFHNNAIALCNKILRHSPGRSSVYYKLGKYSALKGFRADAKKNFLEYADRMQKAQQMDEAFRALKEFADLCPDEDDIRQMLADQFAKLGRNDEAIEQLQLLYERYESTGQSAEAAATIERMKAIDPNVEPKRASPTQARESTGLVFLDLDEPTPRPSRKTFVTPAPPPPRSSKPGRPQSPAVAGLPLIDLDEPEPTPEPVTDVPAVDGLEATAAEPTPPTPVEEIPVVKDITFGASFGTEDAATDDVGTQTLDIEPTSFGDGVAEGVEDPVSSALGSPEDATFGTDSPDEIAEAVEPVTGLESPFDVLEPIEPIAPVEAVESLETIEKVETVESVESIEIEPIETDAFDAEPVATEAAAVDAVEMEPLETEASDAESDEQAAVEALKVDGAMDLDATLSTDTGEATLDPEAVDDVLSDLNLVDTEEAVVAEVVADVAVESVEAELEVTEDAEAALATVDTESGEEDLGADIAAELDELPPPVEPASRRGSRMTLSTLAHSVEGLRARVSTHEGDWQAHRLLGEALLEDGDRDGGIEELEKAMAGFESADDLDSARSVADELILLNPHSVRHHQKRVEYAFRMNDQGRLIESYLDLAGALFIDGQSEKSRAVYQRVLELAPNDERAMAALETFAETAPEPAPAPASEAPRGAPPRRYTATPMTSASIEESAPAPAAASSDDFVDLGDWLREDEAPKSTRMVVEEHEPTGDEDADFSDMLRKFKQGVAENVDEEDYDSHYDLGIAYKEMGLVDEAIAEFQKALRGTTNRVRAYEALGQCFTEKGQHSVAMTILQRAVAEPGVGDDQLVGVLYLLGQAAESLDQPANARGWYQRVFAVDINFRDVQSRMRALEQVRS